MLNQKHQNLIEEDLWKNFDYELKNGWDYDVVITNEELVYRFSKESTTLEKIKSEKKKSKQAKKRLKNKKNE